MRILALDTALGACSVALVENAKVRAARWQERTRGHAEALMGLVSEVEAEAGFGVLACDRLAVTVGPGTFTGLRVGLAAARGFALASAKPLVGITTLQAIAANAAPGDTCEPEARILVLLDAKRGEVYGQAFEAGPDVRPLGVPGIFTHAAAVDLVRQTMAAAPACLVGSGAQLIAGQAGQDAEALVSTVSAQPDAIKIAHLGALIGDPGDALPRPLYLRGPDAKVPTRNPLDP